MPRNNFFSKVRKGSEEYLTKKADDVRRYGVKGLVSRNVETPDDDLPDYYEISYKFAPTDEELEQQKNNPLSISLLISVLCIGLESMREIDGITLDETLNIQTYDNYEVIKRKMRPLHSVDEDTADMLCAGEALESALSEATGEYCIVARSDMMLSPGALYGIVKTIEENPGVDLIYSDEDMVNEAGERHYSPRFKPEYNKALLYTCNYIGGLLCVKTSLLKEIEMPGSEYDGAWQYDITLKLCAKADNICHISRILCHSRANPSGIMDNAIAKRILMEHLERQEIKCEVERTADFGYFRIKCENRDFKNLTVIITSSSRETNKKLEALKSFGVTVKYEPDQKAAKVVLLNTKYGLFLRHASYLPEVDELAEMMGILERPDVAAVGVKTCTKDGMVVQSGLVYFENGFVRPAFAGLYKNHKGYMRRAELTQYVDGICFDCAMVRRDALELTGGFLYDLPRRYRDMDLCLQFKHSGFKVMIDPYICIEVTPGDQANQVEENRARLFMRDRWNEKLRDGGIFYNPNFRKGSADFKLG